MDNEIAQDLSPLIKLYKNGRLERLVGTATVSASLDPETGVNSNDVVISPETTLSARLYIPKSAGSIQTKLPLLVYFHGGGFCVETAFSPVYHNHLNSLSSQANIAIISVNYRLAPEHPLPAAYDDSWAVFKWALAHSNAKGPNEWLNSLVDFGRVFLAGDSAGGNIAHHVALRAGFEGINLRGIVLIHPYFWGKEPIGDEGKDGGSTGDEAYPGMLWKFVNPSSKNGSDDPLINPSKDPNVGKLGCGRVMVCVAEKDGLKDRGWFYKEVLKKSGWDGCVEVVETKGEGHVFHLFNPNSANAVEFMAQISSFINQ